jgi:SPX domain protein involved in polyphosphate accumulation
MKNDETVDEELDVIFSKLKQKINNMETRIAILENTNDKQVKEDKPAKRVIDSLMLDVKISPELKEYIEKVCGYLLDEIITMLDDMENDIRKDTQEKMLKLEERIASLECISEQDGEEKIKNTKDSYLI